MDWLAQLSDSSGIISSESIFFQDLEEQLDQKNRLIKRLQNQIKSLEASQKGETAKQGMQKLKTTKNTMASQFLTLKTNSLFP